MIIVVSDRGHQWLQCLVSCSDQRNKVYSSHVCSQKRVSTALLLAVQLPLSWSWGNELASWL